MIKTAIATTAILLSSISLAKSDPYEKNIQKEQTSTNNDVSTSFLGDKTHLDIKFGGWSKHDSNKFAYMDVPLNETHNGLGFEYYNNFKDTEKHWLGFGLWYMKDSFDTHSFQASVAYKYRIPINYLIDSLELNLNIGLVNRSFRTLYIYEGDIWNGKDWVYEKKFIGYEQYRDTRLITAPMLTVNVTENFHVDMTYMPEKIADELAGQYELFFFRFGYRF